MVTIKSAHINSHGLSGLAGNQASSSPAPCSHKKPGSGQVGAGEKTGTDQMIKVIQLLVDLLTKIFGGKNEPTTSQQTPGTPVTTTAPESQSPKGGSFIDRLGESLLGFFSNAFSKLLG